jgi:hypothetical protein
MNWIRLAQDRDRWRADCGDEPSDSSVTELVTIKKEIACKIYV